MLSDKALKMANRIITAAGGGLMILYGFCNTACSSLRGTFLGVDLQVIGILYMAVLFALTLPPASRFAKSVNHLRTMMLAGALGGEVLLVRFQVVSDLYCSFCLTFGLCIVALFAANFTKMNKYLALSAFLAGAVAFALFFKGSVLPLYT